jgi:RNA polymerase sigma-70 factor, ECF subfamily
MEDNSSDEQLMVLIGQEDEKAFTILLQRYQHLVYGTVYRMLGPYTSETEDLAQQVFIKVWKAAPRYRAEAQFTTWLLTICRNCVFTQLKKSRRTQLEPLAYPDTEGEVETSYPDREMATPADDLLRTELRNNVEAAIRELPENQRTALTLRQQEQLDYEAISQIMKLSVSSVKSLLFRARESLRAKLQEYLHLI